MKLRESKEEEFPSSSMFVKPRNNRVERIRALYFIGDRGQFNKIPSGNIRTWNQAEEGKIHGGDQNKKKEKERERRKWYYGTQKFAPRRSELQLTVDFNDPSKQLRQIELPRATDSPLAAYVRGGWLFENCKGWGRNGRVAGGGLSSLLPLEDWRTSRREFNCEMYFAWLFFNRNLRDSFGNLNLI